MRKLACVGVCACTGAAAFGGAQPPQIDFTAYYSGALTSTDPVFANPGGASGTHHYDVQAFTVGASGEYLIESASLNTTGSPSNALDTFLRVYAGSFNPASPNLNLLASNDDMDWAYSVLPGPFGLAPQGTGYQGAQPSSQVFLVLQPGIEYFIVNTSYRATGYTVTGSEGGPRGVYYTGIGGPGPVQIVPAPAGVALLGIGLLTTRRRRR